MLARVSVAVELGSGCLEHLKTMRHPLTLNSQLSTLNAEGGHSWHMNDPKLSDAIGRYPSLGSNPTLNSQLSTLNS
ncbi:MAG: hypothetical protein ACRC62_09430 [Microcoleus sp.]